MIVAFLSVLLLLTTFVSLGQQQACPTGFFGEKCMYQCKCNSSCTATGECPSKICQDKFFGPNCQFLDGTFLYNGGTTELFIRDADESTCNPNAAATHVIIELRVAVHYLWFRLYASKKSELLNFNVTMNKTVDCLNMRKYPQDDFVDVTCDNSIMGVAELRLDGTVAPSVCSLYISFGRNTALKQETYQRSNFEEGNMSLSQNAVDGYRERNYSFGHCSQTKAEDQPEWHLTFNRLQMIIFVWIFGRQGNTEQLYGFSYQGYSERNSTTVSVKEIYVTQKEVHAMPIFSIIPTRRLRIKGPPKGNISDGTLTLCEVEIYTEMICPPGTFGLWCQNNCLCKSDEICNSVTGACAPGCPRGYYGLAGFGCSMRCGLCQNDTCDQRTGSCKCFPGFKKEDCSIECDPGFYGQDCAFKCGKGCTETCDTEIGNCSCKSTFFVPPNCEGCIDRHYGPNCDQPCSATCLNGTCIQSSGDCVGCVDGYSGLSCGSKTGAEGSTAGDGNMLMHALVFVGVGFAIASIGYLFCTKRGAKETAEAQ